MTDDDIPPELLAAMGAKIDQAKQHYVDAVDALIDVTRRKADRPGDPMNHVSVAITAWRALRKQNPDDPENQLWTAVNMLADASLRLAFPDNRSNLNTPEGDTP